MRLVPQGNGPGRHLEALLHAEGFPRSEADNEARAQRQGQIASLGAHRPLRAPLIQPVPDPRCQHCTHTDIPAPFTFDHSPGPASVDVSTRALGHFKQVNS